MNYRYRYEKPVYRDVTADSKHEDFSSYDTRLLFLSKRKQDKGAPAS